MRAFIASPPTALHRLFTQASVRHTYTLAQLTHPLAAATATIVGPFVQRTLSDDRLQYLPHHHALSHSHTIAASPLTAPKAVLAAGASPYTPSRAVLDAVMTHAATLSSDPSPNPALQCSESFFVLDVERVREKLAHWHEVLPSVTPFYAVKANPHPAIIECLAQGGAGFDCASPGEIALVTERVGVDSDRIIFANPCKSPGALRMAANAGVPLTTADTCEELHKIGQIAPNMGVVIRIYVDDSDAQCSLSNKFGAHRGQWQSLLDTATRLGISIRGISFHVGSGGTLDGLTSALTDAHDLYTLAHAAGHPVNLLDIGGGWPGSCIPSANNPHGVMLEAASTIVKEALARYPRDSMKFIAEPGRYFCAEASTLAAMVIARSEREGRKRYFLANSVYSSFNSVIFDHTTLINHETPSIFEEDETCTVFGQTCDGIDQLSSQLRLPDMHVGDWVVFPAMGAYTSAASSTFNGFHVPDTVVLPSREHVLGRYD